jgi:hypothetical protein
MMSMMNPEKFKQVCDGVWRDRAAILTGRGNLRGEAALLRAVYWRLRKAGGAPEGEEIETCDAEQMLPIYQRLVGTTLTGYAPPHFDSAPLLNELVTRYMYEAGQSR